MRVKNADLYAYIAIALFIGWLAGTFSSNTHFSVNSIHKHNVSEYDVKGFQEQIISVIKEQFIPILNFVKNFSVTTDCHYPAFTLEGFQAKRSELETALAAKSLTVNEGYSAQLDTQIQVYQHVFSRCNVRSIAEIGFNGGHSALIMLMSNPSVEIQSFDIGDHAYAPAALEVLNAMYPGRNLKVEWGDSTTTIPAFHARNPDKTFDVVIVDGGHSYEVATADVINMRLLSNAQTVLIVDDTPCQASYCVDRVIDEQESRGYIKVTERWSIEPGRGFILAKYLFETG